MFVCLVLLVYLLKAEAVALVIEISLMPFLSGFILFEELVAAEVSSLGTMNIVFGLKILHY